MRLAHRSTAICTRRARASHRAVSRPAERSGPKVLLAVAHPDDEYVVAATAYRIARELNGTVDQVVVTDGAGGYRYSAMAEASYGIPLSKAEVGRAQLPAIRKRETVEAGRVLGIRQHYFLGQPDDGYTLDPTEGERLWNCGRVRTFLADLLTRERHEYVMVLLPTEDTHGHHQTTAALVREAIGQLPVADRPAVLGAEPGLSSVAARRFGDGLQTYEFSRTSNAASAAGLPYTVVVNWAVAAHKSQGLFQLEAGKHDVERFWVLSDNGRPEAAARLFNALCGSDWRG